MLFVKHVDVEVEEKNKIFHIWSLKIFIDKKEKGIEFIQEKKK